MYVPINGQNQQKKLASVCSRIAQHRLQIVCFYWTRLSTTPTAHHVLRPFCPRAQVHVGSTSEINVALN